MTSRTSFQTKRLEFCKAFHWELKKNAGISGLLAALQFLCMPLILLLEFPQWKEGRKLQYASTTKPLEQYESYLKSAIPAFVLSLSLLFAVIFCVRLFGYMQNKRSVDLYHALPVGRGSMFLGRWCAGAVLLSVPVALNFGITMWVAAANGISSAALIKSTLQAMGWVLLFSVAVFTFCSFFVVCSGSMMDTFLSVFGINVGFPLTVYLGYFLTAYTVPGMAISGGDAPWQIMTLLAPFPAAYLPLSSDTVSAGFLPWWLCFTAALLVGALLVYRKRKSELAESQLAFPVPKIISRFLLTICGGLTLGLIVGQANLPLFLTGVAAGSLAVHTAVEAAYSRGFQGLKKSFRWYAAFAVCFAVFYGVFATGCFGYDTAVPEESQIESVSAQTLENNSGENFVVVEGKTIYLKPKMKQAESIRTVLQAQRNIISWYRKNSFPYVPCSCSNDLTLTYHLKDGRTITRSYSLFSEFRNQQEALLKYADSITELAEYRSKNDVLYFFGPQDINVVRIGSGDSPSGKTLDMKSYLLSGRNLPLAQELMEALRSESFGNVSSLDSNNSGLASVELDYRGRIVPGTELSEALGKKYPYVDGTSSLYYYRKGGKVDSVLQKITKELTPYDENSEQMTVPAE